MSAPGIGVGDIVDGIKFGYKAIEAVREDEDGAKQHYQKSQRALAYRLRAFENLQTTIASGFSNGPLSDFLEAVINEDASRLVEAAKLEQSLGRGAKPGVFHSPFKKVKYNLDDDKIQEHHNRTKPMVDAAILGGIGESIRAVKDTSETGRQRLQNLVKQLQHQMAAADISKDFRVFEVESEQRHLKILDLLHHLLGPRHLSPAGTSQGSAPNILQTDPLSSHRSDPASSSSQIVKTARVASRKPPPSDQARHQDNRAVSDVLALLVAMATASAYKTPAIRRAIVVQISEAREDPVLATIFILVAIAFFRVCIRVPRLLENICDDSIQLQTALGEDIRISSLYWKTQHSFHQFLEGYFETRPGKSWVTARQYRILLRDNKATIVEPWRWPTLIRRRMKLKMSMIIDSPTVCPRCAGSLDSTASLARHCEHCTQIFSVLPAAPRCAMLKAAGDANTSRDSAHPRSPMSRDSRVADTLAATHFSSEDINFRVNILIAESRSHSPITKPESITAEQESHTPIAKPEAKDPVSKQETYNLVSKPQSTTDIAAQESHNPAAEPAPKTTIAKSEGLRIGEQKSHTPVAQPEFSSSIPEREPQTPIAVGREKYNLPILLDRYVNSPPHLSPYMYPYLTGEYTRPYVRDLVQKLDETLSAFSFAEPSGRPDSRIALTELSGDARSRDTEGTIRLMSWADDL